MVQLKAFPGAIGKVFPIRKIDQGFRRVTLMKIGAIGKSTDAGI
jgi:hypothetical protein